MISVYDLTTYDFLLLCMHVISAMLYISLAMKIVQLKKYLKWNKHIYPRMMVAAIGIAIVFLSELVAKQNYNIFFHLFMWLFAFNQFSELFRLVEKYNKIEELQKRIQMKNLIILLFIASLLLVSCGSRKAEIEKLNKERTEIEKNHREEKEKLNAKISEKDKKEAETKKEIETAKTQIDKLQTENKKLVQKLNEQKKDDINITNANGMVIVTDSNGNKYEIPSGDGTVISRKSESTLTKELESVTETLAKEQQTNQFLKQNLSDKVSQLKQKELELSAFKALQEKQYKKLQDIENEKKKNTERKAYPVFLWILLGVFLTVLAQLLWKVYKPKLLKK